jgi:opacity protein-like surface antigen
MRKLPLAAASLVIGAVAVLAPSRAIADEGEPPPRRLGVGYKIGNGLGVVGGDVFLRLIDHLAVDLQVNYASTTDDATMNDITGYGLAPAIHAEWNPRGSTPYLSLGYLYIHMSEDNITGSAPGFFANLGYDFKFNFGLGIMLGAGVVHLGNIHVTDGINSLDAPGGTFFNIEAGIRYMLF